MNKNDKNNDLRDEQLIGTTTAFIFIFTTAIVLIIIGVVIVDVLGKIQ